MKLSIVQSATAMYPSSRYSYSPSTRYPEYKWDVIAEEKNVVYDSVRNALAQLRLDSANYGTDLWNPLGDYICKGDNVFILCNFVHHRRHFESSDDFLSKCTHGSVLRAVADYVLIAAGPTGQVSFGNAPLQSCDWNAVLRETGAENVARFYEDRGRVVIPTDLRLVVSHRDFAGREIQQTRRDEDLGITVTLGHRSLLGQIDRDDVRYRVSDYDPDRTGRFHSASTHNYVIHRKILDANVIVSVPKLKTHEKVAITCAVKGFVGTVGHKDSLAHHRAGAAKAGGDEYPKSSVVLAPISWFHDLVQRHGQQWGTFRLQLARIVDKNARRIARRLGYILFGAWHGNDTTWRMAVDLARLVHYCNKYGEISAEPQRRHLVVIDGIVGGEGEGPLSPKPVHTGTVIVSDNVVLADLAASRVMGYDYEKIPIISGAIDLVDLPVATSADFPQAQVKVTIDGAENSSLNSIRQYAFVPPKGWRSVLG